MQPKSASEIRATASGRSWEAPLARWISVFFDSSVLSLPVFTAFGWQEARLVGVAWGLLAFLIMTGVPLGYVLLGRRRGWVSDLELSRRDERPRFILVSLGSDVLALAVLTAGGAPRVLSAMALTYLALGATMFTVSNYWKISLHMVGVAGFATALVIVYGPGAAWAYLSLPLVAWARLRRKKHSVSQLVVGALAGAAITGVVFGWFVGLLA
jgi:hypothetical protein